MEVEEEVEKKEMQNSEGGAPIFSSSEAGS